jgi:hypothetical protein
MNPPAASIRLSPKHVLGLKLEPQPEWLSPIRSAVGKSVGALIVTSIVP